MKLLHHRDALDAVRGRVAALASLRTPGVEGFCDHVRDVVIIGSSSRGGSSIFAETLRCSPELIHLRAEINPFLVLAGLGAAETGAPSDALAPGAPHDHALLERELALDAGCRPADDRDQVHMAADLAWRFLVQWPQIDFEPERLVAIIAAVLARQPAGSLGNTSTALATIAAVRAHHPAVSPWFYDLEPACIQAAFPGLAPPKGPPGSLVIEEPPFVNIGPWRRATAADLRARPLLIKTPSNAYRLAFLRDLFPRARFRVLHLTRNPAASINGLVDGWRFRGFHAHRVAPPLSLDGYGDDQPGDRAWWKYDLPPGWQTRTTGTLEAACAHQWTSAHAAILTFLEDNPEVSTHRLRFEDLIGPPGVRRQAMAATLQWLGAGHHPRLTRAIDEPLPPIMATARPRRKRWFERAALLEPVLADPDLRQVAAALGYADRDAWI